MVTYLQILNIIKDTALAQPNVNSVVREFLDLNREDAKYSAVVIQDRDGSRDRIVEQDYVTYTWHLGYVDRLTYDESNRDDIISTGINIINNIVNTIRNTWFPELEVSIVDRINTFDQRFTAQCAGVYVVLAVNAQVSDCIDSESTDLYDTYDAKITANGVYHFVPSGRPVDEINITVDVPGSIKDIEWGSIKGNISDQTDLVNYLGVMTSDIKSWVSEQGYLTEHQDLSSYALKSEIPSLAGYATETWVESKGYLTEHQDLSSYALKSEIPSLAGYATESWVTNQGYITSIPDTFATKTWVSSQGYLTEHQDLSSYALKSEIPSLSGYATESWVSTNFLSNIPDTYATKSWVSEQGYLTEHQSLTGYATESWVESKGYLTEHQDLSSYALKSEIPSLAGYATESWVESKGYLTEHQDLSSYALKSEIPSLAGYATESWVESKGYLTEHQDLSSYATKSWATSQFLEESKIWTGTQSAWDALTSSQKASYTISLITE